MFAFTKVDPFIQSLNQSKTQISFEFLGLLVDWINILFVIYPHLFICLFILFEWDYSNVCCTINKMIEAQVHIPAISNNPQRG